jgi:hypothetical protein
MIQSYLKYPALTDYCSTMDPQFNIPNKYFTVFNATSTLKFNSTISPDVPKFIYQLYTINNTIPVELYMTPKINYSDSFLMLVLNKDYKNGTYIAKTKKSFHVKLYDNPTFYLVTVYENDYRQDNDKLLQQILIDKNSYSVTYLMPFDLSN